MYRCGNEPKPESQWQGENINRYCDPKYDACLLYTSPSTRDVEEYPMRYYE